MDSCNKQKPQPQDISATVYWAHHRHVVILNRRSLFNNWQQTNAIKFNNFSMTHEMMLKIKSSSFNYAVKLIIRHIMTTNHWSLKNERSIVWQ